MTNLQNFLVLKCLNLAMTIYEHDMILHPLEDFEIRLIYSI